MHDGASWGAWGHEFPGFGHGLLGLLVTVLIVVVIVLLLRNLFRNKD